MNPTSPANSLASLDWGAVALVAVLALALLGALVLFLRQNRKDLESLEETIEEERAEDGEAADRPRP
ncbi:hypothetical protein [Accumulibacter sp.]|uniref:hypothetical protein n=1 Tax=Accumulibacter sp. TaxID=2053492 RepID=UPI0025DB5197|nr:hypothetical protein [Accumulibacter sp.]MCM8596961.1 hypothetical protein [Accumulibacter sp.]MCM8624455.1 hypothetical protein [Accumulibacter sp.]MDS4051110.1 hypothetical protein [Accumulibacter sp.]